MDKLILAIDFDMTISNNHNYRDLSNPPVHYAAEAIRSLKHMGCTLILWTCRSGDSLEQAKQYLSKYGILDCFSYFNENTAEIVDAWGGTGSPKVYADVYIDDRNALMRTVNWYEILSHIRNTVWLQKFGSRYRREA